MAGNTNGTSGDTMRSLLKIGTFLLGALMLIAASGMFFYYCFFNPEGASSLSSAQQGGLLIIGTVGAVGIFAAILMEYGNG